MKWIKYTINTTADREDAVCLVLNKFDITALEIEDSLFVEESVEKEGGFFEELQPDLDASDKSARISFYVDENEDFSGTLARLREELLQEEITTDISDEADWRDNWKEFFHSFSIGDLLIKPTWEELDPADAGRPLIEIDPGISFGTGKHETTRMCIEALQEKLSGGEHVLDVGCGSGILSIAALKLGAADVVGTDIDPDCMESVASNFKINHLDEKFGTFYVGNLTDDAALQKKVGGGYDVVVANILADIIIGMTDALYAALKPGGTLICSGIIDFKENEVADRLNQAGLAVADVRHDGEWVAIIAEKEE